MKILVTYLSKTGNTKKIAEAIYEEITDDKEIKPIDEVESITDYDVTFLGFPIHQMGPDKKEVSLMERHCTNGRNIVLFLTHAAPEDNPELQPMLGKFIQAASGANIIDMFDCQGELAKGVKLIMSIMPDARLRRWAKQDNSQGQPDETRVNRAHDFTKKVMQRVHEQGFTKTVKGLALAR
jgi:flavodoxin